MYFGIPFLLIVLFLFAIRIRAADFEKDIAPLLVEHYIKIIYSAINYGFKLGQLGL